MRGGSHVGSAPKRLPIVSTGRCSSFTTSGAIAGPGVFVPEQIVPVDEFLALNPAFNRPIIPA